MRFTFSGYVPKELTDKIRSLKGDYEISFKKVTGKRTLKQNSAIHLWCEWFSQELTEKHIDQRTFWKEPFYTRWTPVVVKEFIFKPVMKALFLKDSTTKLKKSQEIDEVIDTIRKMITEKYKGEVIVPPLPNKEDKEEEEYKKFINK